MKKVNVGGLFLALRMASSPHKETELLSLSRQYAPVFTAAAPDDDFTWILAATIDI